MYCEWYGIFLENIHMLDFRPNKWLKNSRLPVLEDIVLFVFNDSEYGKAGMDWRLGKITVLKVTQVSVMYSVKGAKAKLPLCTQFEGALEMYLSSILQEILWSTQESIFLK